MPKANWKKWRWPSHWSEYYRTFDRVVYKHTSVFGPFTWTWLSYDVARNHKRADV